MDAIQLVFALVVFCGQVWFCVRRKVFPIRDRFPWLVLTWTCGCLGYLFLSSLELGSLCDNAAYLALYWSAFQLGLRVVVLLLCFETTKHAMLNRQGSVYGGSVIIDFSDSKRNGLSLHDVTHARGLGWARASRPHRPHRPHLLAYCGYCCCPNLATNTCLFALSFGTAVVLGSVFAILCQSDWSAASKRLNALWYVGVVPSALGFLPFMVRLSRHGNDGFYLKTEFRILFVIAMMFAICSVLIACLIDSVAARTKIGRLALNSAVCASALVSLVFPTAVSYLHQHRAALHVATHISQILEVPAGFRAYLQFATQEFSVENPLFFGVVTKFRQGARTPDREHKPGLIRQTSSQHQHQHDHHEHNHHPTSHHPTKHVAHHHTPHAIHSNEQRNLKIVGAHSHSNANVRVTSDPVVLLARAHEIARAHVFTSGPLAVNCSGHDRENVRTSLAALDDRLGRFQRQQQNPVENNTTENGTKDRDRDADAELELVKDIRQMFDPILSSVVDLMQARDYV